MSRPDWKDAPEWAMHLAMDESSCWWWYEFEPQVNEDHWSGYGRARPARAITKDWFETLERRP